MNKGVLPSKIFTQPGNKRGTHPEFLKEFGKITNCHQFSQEQERASIYFYMFDVEMMEFRKDKDPKRLQRAHKALYEIVKILRPDISSKGDNMTKKTYELKLRCSNCGTKSTANIPFGKVWQDYVGNNQEGKFPKCKNCGCETLRGWT